MLKCRNLSRLLGASLVTCAVLAAAAPTIGQTEPRFSIKPLAEKRLATLPAKFEERILKPVHGSIVDSEERVRVGEAQIVLSSTGAIFEFVAESLTIWCDLSGRNAAPLEIALVTPSGETAYKTAAVAGVEVIAGSQEHTQEVTALFEPAKWDQASGFRFRMPSSAGC